MRGRDHDAEIGPQRAGQHADRRRRQRAEQHHVHADRDEARGQRRLQHVARQPRVLADHDQMAMVAAGELRAGGHGDRQRGLGGDRLAVRRAADAVGAEKLATHGGFISWRAFPPD